MFLFVAALYTGLLFFPLLFSTIPCQVIKQSLYYLLGETTERDVLHIERQRIFRKDQITRMDEPLEALSSWKLFHDRKVDGHMLCGMVLA